MVRNKSKQLFLFQFFYPFETIKMILQNNDFEEFITKKEGFRIKKFIGSDWNIKDSGFIYYGNDNLKIGFTLKNFQIDDFIILQRFKIEYVNDKRIKNKFEIVFSIIKNTSNDTSILEIRLEYNSDSVLNNLECQMVISKITNIFNKSYSKLNLCINELFSNDNTFSIVINHSFLIKKNYKEAFEFFYNWNNLAKCLKTDKIWKIYSEKHKANQRFQDFYIIVNNTKIHYTVISIDTFKDEKIEVSYNKENNSFPAMNNYIKFSFFNISNELCYFLYETHLPINISSSIYQTASKYLFYCNNKSKNYIENKL